MYSKSFLKFMITLIDRSNRIVMRMMAKDSVSEKE